jgi:hypothetical protein
VAEVGNQVLRFAESFGLEFLRHHRSTRVTLDAVLRRVLWGIGLELGLSAMIEYPYEPDLFRIGAIVSLAGAILLLTLAWSSPSRRSRMRSAATSDQV